MATIEERSMRAEIRTLSKDKFNWVVKGNFDKLAELLDDDLDCVINRDISTKEEWLAELRSGRLVYRAIEEKEAYIKTYFDTAIIVGKANFYMDVNGLDGVLHFYYTEVYIRKYGQWKLVNIHCSAECPAE